MVRILGPLHTDSAAGTVSGITHRQYRGSNIASVARSKTRVRPKITSINDPRSLPGCFGWWNLSRGVTLSDPPPPLKVLCIRDNTYIQGHLIETDPTIAPTYHASDPLHNNRPYCTFDGVNDRLRTPVTSPTHQQPLEFWMVFQDFTTQSDVRELFATHNAGTYWLRRTGGPPYPYRINFGNTLDVIAAQPTGVHLIRLVVNGVNSFAELDGVAQLPPGNAGTHPLIRLIVGARYDLTSFTNLSLFDLAVFNVILNPVNRQLLINWYFKWFNLP